MKNTIKHISMLAASLISFSGIVRAEVNPSNFVQSGYWYADEDIRGILKLKTGDNAYIAPALPFESRELVKDIIVASVEQVRQSGSALIPINFGNSHWVALALRKGESGSIKAIYNDSFGNALSNTTNGSYVLEVLQEIDPTIELIDLQVRQQSDGSSCGAFTAENLAVIASLDISTLSQDQLKEILSKINDAAGIRRSHFYLFYNAAQGTLDVVALKPKAELIASNIAHQHQQISSSLRNVQNLIHDRLGSLNRSSYLTGLSSGDEQSIYGVWLKGYLGNSKLETNLVSLYGSGNIDDDLVINLDASCGMALIKNTPINNNSSSKRKATVLGANALLNYNYSLSEDLVLTPAFGMSYGKFTLKGYEDSGVKVKTAKPQTLSLVAGLTLTTFIDTKTFTFIPEVMMRYMHGVWNKGNKQIISSLINQSILQQKIGRGQKTMEVGAGVTIAGDTTELGGGYERAWQGKSVSQVGYIKLRVNF
ncbi:MAG: autotransporter domain-containing protein [Proteobacteria bacterium]|nr:autotransporter domain-containing protein [Pseudomonadota bacterium]